MINFKRDIRHEEVYGTESNMLNIIIKMPYENKIRIHHVYHYGWSTINKISTTYKDGFLHSIVSISLGGEKWKTNTLEKEIEYWENTLYKKASKRLTNELKYEKLSLIEEQKRIEKYNEFVVENERFTTIKDIERTKKLERLIDE